jgi:hypothetical protein
VIFFLLGAAIGFLSLWLLWPIIAGLARGLETSSRERAPAALRPPRSWRTFVASYGTDAVRLGLLAAVLSPLAVLADWRFLEAEVNIRLIFGGVFGALIAVLVLARRPPAPASPATGFADSAAAASPAGGDASAAGFWTSKQLPLVSIALIALPLLALIAPHGELDLGFVRSVKTPFIEAQFTQNEVEFRLDLQSEPQGFFRLGADGLGDALHMARNEVIFRQQFPAADSGASRIASPADALAFLGEVLQPMALCAHEADRLYGDQELLAATLRIGGQGLARALTLSMKAVQDQQPATAAGEALVRQTLRDSFVRLDEMKAQAIPALSRLAANGSACEQDFAARLDSYLAGLERRERDSGADTAEPLSAVMRNPAVAHATAMIFLWSGNPRAVLRILETGDEMAGALTRAQAGAMSLAEYPALHQIRGYATRWEGVRGNDAYLAMWEDGISQLQSRLERLKQASPAVTAQCVNRALPVFAFTEDGITQPLSADTRPPGCLGRSADECNVMLAYGYYAFSLQKLRNHLMFETARELMLKRLPHTVDAPLFRAIAHAKRAAAFVAADGLRSGHCFTQQVARAGNGTGAAFAITLTNPEHEYAAVTDSHGSLIVAKALLIDRGDKAAIETAISEFERALSYAALANDGGGFVETIREHHWRARKALGLTTR